MAELEGAKHRPCLYLAVTADEPDTSVGAVRCGSISGIIVEQRLVNIFVFVWFLFSVLTSQY